MWIATPDGSIVNLDQASSVEVRGPYGAESLYQACARLQPEGTYQVLSQGTERECHEYVTRIYNDLLESTGGFR